MLSRLFSNHLKIIKIADFIEFHIENVQSAEYQTGLRFFYPKIVQLYIIMYFYII